jgi:shikimate 5-dehydrogenase
VPGGANGAVDADERVVPGAVGFTGLVERSPVPLDTELIRSARRRGCRVADGGGMVVYQAAASFRLFTGLPPDEERMYRDFVELTDGDRHA